MEVRVLGWLPYVTPGKHVVCVAADVGRCPVEDRFVLRPLFHEDR